MRAGSDVRRRQTEFVRGVFRVPRSKREAKAIWTYMDTRVEAPRFMKQKNDNNPRA